MSNSGLSRSEEEYEQPGMENEAYSVSPVLLSERNTYLEGGKERQGLREEEEQQFEEYFQLHKYKLSCP